MAITLVVRGSLRLIIIHASGNQRHQGSKLRALSGSARPWQNRCARKRGTPGRAPSFRPHVTQLCWGGFGLSYKHQALTCRILYDRIQTMNEKQLKRIADAIEEILRLVKKDMEPKK